MTSGNMFPRWTAFERISRYFHMKVDSDLEVNSRPVLCVRPAVFNAPDNLEIFNLANQLTCRICTLSFASKMSPWNASPRTSC